MSSFSYNDYQNAVAAAQSAGTGNSSKIGFFKLANDGDIAIARLNVSSMDDVSFTSVHTISANGKWLKVSCLDPFNAHAGSCPLCSADKSSVSKASKKCYIQMLVSYRDATSQSFTEPQAVVWERPASFSKEIANKLLIAGDLKNTLVIITRNGKAGDLKTTYSMDLVPANHPVFKSEMVPADFSAFANFSINKHSYWEKTVEEMNAFLQTGQFPEVIRTQQATVNSVQGATAIGTTPVFGNVPIGSNNVSGQVNPVPQNPQAQVYTYAQGAVPQMPTTPVAPQQPVNATPVNQAPTDQAPARQFSGFNF